MKYDELQTRLLLCDQPHEQWMLMVEAGAAITELETELAQCRKKTFEEAISACIQRANEMAEEWNDGYSYSAAQECVEAIREKAKEL